jgi:hypothetical protein
LNDRDFIESLFDNVIHNFFECVVVFYHYSKIKLYILHKLSCRLFAYILTKRQRAVFQLTGSGGATFGLYWLPKKHTDPPDF